MPPEESWPYAKWMKGVRRESWRKKRSEHFKEEGEGGVYLVIKMDGGSTEIGETDYWMQLSYLGMDEGRIEGVINNRNKTLRGTDSLV